MWTLDHIEGEWCRPATREELRQFGNETNEELRQLGNETKRREDFSHRLRSPVERGFFCACHAAVQVGDVQTLSAWLRKDDEKKQRILRSGGEFLYPFFRAHLLCSLVACRAKEFSTAEYSKSGACAQALLEATWRSFGTPQMDLKFETFQDSLVEKRWASDNVTPPALAHTAISLLSGDFPSSPDSRLALGLIRDLVQELFTPGMESRKPERGILCGNLRPGSRPLAVTALLVDEDREVGTPKTDERDPEGKAKAKEKGSGVVANLWLEMLPEGTGVLYPIPALALVARDDKFLEAEDNACTYLRRPVPEKGLGLWPEGDKRDVRWRVEPRGKRWIKALNGPSLGGWWALAIGRLLVENATALSS